MPTLHLSVARLFCLGLALSFCGSVMAEDDAPRKKGRGKATATPIKRIRVPAVRIVAPVVRVKKAEPAKKVKAANLSPEEKIAQSPTHAQSSVIKPVVDGKTVTIQTFTVAADGNLWVCTTKPAARRPRVTSVSKTKATKKDALPSTPGQIAIFTPDGKVSKTIEMEFIPTAINFTADGKNVFVAGNGFIAKLNAKGDVLKSVASPSIPDMKEFRAKVVEDAKKQAESRAKLFKDQLKRYDEMIAKLEKTKEDDRTAGQNAQLKALKRQHDLYAKYAKQYSGQTNMSDAMVRSAMSSKLRINALAVTDENVFVSCMTMVGYGYDVWKMNHELTDGKVVLEKLRGCCGRMDIQTDGKALWVAENTKFRVGHYSTEGKLLGSWGSRDREAVVGFGSCCNPMNVRCCANGDVLTSESSIGKIKRFSPDGKLLTYIGQATIGGGCKNVPISHDESRDVYYMLNTTSNHICVLTKKADKKTAQVK